MIASDTNFIVTIEPDKVTKKFEHYDGGSDVDCDHFFKTELDIARCIIPGSVISHDTASRTIVYRNLGQPLTTSEISVRELHRGLQRQLRRLRQYGVVHLDIKPENIVVGRKNKVHLVDFESGYFTARGPRKTIYGTIGYLSPRTLLVQPPREDIDDWGAAIVVLEYECGYNPAYEYPFEVLEELFPDRNIENLGEALEVGTSDVDSKDYDLYRNLLASAILIGVNNIPRSWRDSADYWFDGGRFIYDDVVSDANCAAFDIIAADIDDDIRGDLRRMLQFRD